MEKERGGRVSSSDCIQFPGKHRQIVKEKNLALFAAEEETNLAGHIQAQKTKVKGPQNIPGISFPAAVETRLAFFLHQGLPKKERGEALFLFG